MDPGGAVGGGANVCRVAATGVPAGVFTAEKFG
jgi:hypothetical protein